MRTQVLLRLLVCTLILLVGGGVGFYAGTRISTSNNEVLLKNSEYPHISPLLSCTSLSTVSEKGLAAAQEQVKKYIAEQKKLGTVTDVALYFRDLQNGGWFGVNESITFSPSSLLKVPLMMSALYASERNPSLLAKEVVFERADPTLPQTVPVDEPLTLGSTYSLNTLMERMITESDNDAASMLYRALGPATVNKTYRDLGLKEPELGNDYTTTVHDYASFFRILYNSTYLTFPDSERALELLTRADYRDGLVAGVPAGVPVAHKFGEREVGDLNQLHDCGIVYEAQRPYLLCIMTRGNDRKKLSGVIQALSNIMYTTVHNQ